MTDFTQRSPEEAKTHELFAPIYRGGGYWSPSRVIVANVFTAMWTGSLTVDKIELIACAMFGFKEISLQEALTELTREKVLRSRVDHGRRFYEVNY